MTASLLAFFAKAMARACLYRARFRFSASIAMPATSILLATPVHACFARTNAFWARSISPSSRFVVSADDLRLNSRSAATAIGSRNEGGLG